MTRLERSYIFSFNGSGLWGKIPVGSQYNFTTSTPNFSNSFGTAIPPVELTASTTIF